MINRGLILAAASVVFALSLVGCSDEKKSSSDDGFGISKIDSASGTSSAVVTTTFKTVREKIESMYNDEQLEKTRETVYMILVEQYGEVDSDGDGLPDTYETQVSKTDHQKVDTDGDGYDDFEELFVADSNPLEVDE